MTNSQPGKKMKRTAIGRVLPRRFYYRSTARVAKELLGKVLRVRHGRTWRSGIIVETEAYVKNDPANHAFHGPTQRNRSMFKGPGTAYVYRIHQVYCVNAVTRKGQAVLIRAIQSLGNASQRTDGPGKLCQALAITKIKHDGKPLTGPHIQIRHANRTRLEVSVSRRIGVTKGKNRLLRYIARPATA